jgi:acetylornithine deacetylase/succinyl-diaminopimelate desuccinylase-like protein
MTAVINLNEVLWMKNWVLVVLLLCVAASSFAQSLPPERQLARDILKELVEINSTSDVVGTEQIANAVIARLRAGGFSAEDARIAGPDAKHSNVIITLHGRATAKPIVLMAHLDAVTARREDWSTDPYKFTERDGFYYGRGVGDDKSGDATIITNMLRWKREGWQPERDIIALLTSDEETSGNQGIHWLVENVPAVKTAELALNADAGGGELINGKRATFDIQASEKIYADYEFTVRDKGGHSSRPRNADNPIYRLAQALQRLAAYQFPLDLNDITRTYFERAAALYPANVATDMRALAAGKATPDALARLSANPQFNAMMRTTCVATLLEGGHAPNALPQMARANVNCRILPNENAADIQRKLEEIFAPNKAELRIASPAKPSPPSPLRPEIMRVFEQLVAQHFPGAFILPDMSTGATDGLWVRNAGVPVYGALALFEDPIDSRAHGRDERIGVESFFNCVDFWHDLVPALSKLP